MTDIIHTTELDKHTRMVIRDVEINAPERYIWNIHFLDEKGEACGSCSEGILYLFLTSSVKSVVDIVPN